MVIIWYFFLKMSFQQSISGLFDKKKHKFLNLGELEIMMKNKCFFRRENVFIFQKCIFTKLGRREICRFKQAVLLRIHSPWFIIISYSFSAARLKFITWTTCWTTFWRLMLNLTVQKAQILACSLWSGLPTSKLQFKFCLQPCPSSLSTQKLRRFR